MLCRRVPQKVEEVHPVRNILFAAIVIAAFFTASVAQTPQAPAPLAGLPGPSQGGPPDYVIGPADILEIKVRNDSTLDSTVLVRPDGKITVQLLADVQAAGLTTMQLADRITAGLGKYYTSGTPAIAVSLLEMKSKFVYIQGHGIAKAGQVALSGPLTIMQLIAMSGGLTEYAKVKEIQVFRDESGVTKVIQFNYETFQSRKDVSQNIPLRSGDIVDVP